MAACLRMPRGRGVGSPAILEPACQGKPTRLQLRSQQPPPSHPPSLAPLLLTPTTTGEVIKPGTFKCLPDEGMPFQGRPFMKGNMYVRFNVDFPESVTSAQAAAIRGALPAAASQNNGAAMDTDEAEEVHRITNVADIEQELKSRVNVGKSAGASYESDDDDDDMPRGQRVQCAQQ